MPAKPYILSEKQQLGIVKMVNNFSETMSELWDVRSSMEIRDKDYMREGNVDIDHLRAQAANRAGDKKRMQDIVFPIVMPQIESALAYQVQIFCSGYPMFQVVSSPAQIDTAVQMNTLLGEQQIAGAWPREVALYLRDGLKYNIHAMEIEWKKKKIYRPVTDLQFDPKVGKPETVWWEGNCLRRMDLYNTIWDKRVLPSRVHIDGEFAGFNELMTRIQLKKLFADLPSDFTTNATKAFESATPASNTGRQSFYIPQLNPNALIKWDPKASTNWLSWMMADEGHQGIKYNDMYEVATIYARIIPADFQMNIPAKNSVQIWKFIVVNWQILIYAEQLHNAHDYLPIIFGQPLEDGLAYQTKSFGENVSNLQDLSSAMWNALLASKRRQVMDRLVYDPSRISVNDINSTNPVARIPVRPAAYGKPLNEALYQIPFNDQNASELAQTAAQVGEMADIINGQNRVQRGQFQKGNKTLQEFQDTMMNSNIRQQMMALLIEYQSIAPIKEIIKTNILQYQSAQNVYNREIQETIAIDPAALRAAQLEYQVADGLLPVDKMVSSDILQANIQACLSNEQAYMEWDAMGMFAYWSKLNGARWLEDFRRTPEQKQALMANYTAMQAAQGLKNPNAGQPEGQSSANSPT